MPHDESLVFRILRLLGKRQTLEQHHLVHQVGQLGEYDPATVQQHLQRMQNFGLVKCVQVSNSHTLYQLGWAGYDYLDDR